METAIFRAASPSVYNRLPGVFEADESVRRDGHLERFLKQVAPLFIMADVAPFIGVGLLHKHNYVEDGHIMSQIEGWYEGEPALICSHTKCDGALGESVAPILYDLSAENDLVGLEFSADPLVINSHARLMERTEFIRSFQLALHEYNLHGQLGFSIIGRTFYYNNKKNGLIAVEQSDLPSTANVIRLRKEAEIDKETLIQTSWSFSAEDQSQCIPLCSSVCVMRSPGHSREHYPNHGMIA